MRRIRILTASAAVAVASVTLAVGPAAAAETQSAPLVCDNGRTATVTGFGRGQVFHVVGTNENYVVTSARLSTGELLFEAPGAERGRTNLVTCTTTSPVSGTSYVFRGFFTS